MVPYRKLRGTVTFLTRKAVKERGSTTQAQFVWGVSAASRFVPKSTCLVKALALHVLLKRAGLESSIHFGVAKESAQFEAHAWVESQSQILIGHFESDRFVPMMVWD